MTGRTMRGGSWVGALVSLAALGGVLWAVDPAVAWTRVSDADPRMALGALVLCHVAILAAAVRWRDTAGRLGQDVGAWLAVREYYVASLLNQILPGGVAGDAVRAWRGRSRGGLGAVARGVAIERMSGQIALAAALGIGVTLGGVPGLGRLAAVFALGLGAVLAAMALFRGMGADLRRAWGSPGALLRQGGVNVAFSVALVGGFALASAAVGAPLGPGAALVLVPACLAAMLVPAGFGGLGLREGAAAALWPLAGWPADAGVAAALLFGLAALGAALPGALFLAR